MSRCFLQTGVESQSLLAVIPCDGCLSVATGLDLETDQISQNKINPHKARQKQDKSRPACVGQIRPDLIVIHF